MITPVDRNTPIQATDKPSYSKLAVVGLFLATLPALILWTVLVVICLPLKAWNCICKKQIHWVNALMHEYLNFYSLSIRYPFSKKYHFTPGTGKPILLIHGYLHNASGWYSLINRLRNENLGPIYAIDLGDGTIGGKFWSIDRYAQQVFRKAQDIAVETGRPDIALIGHSMGGVVAMKVAKLMPLGTVTDVYTIGSPLKGSNVAKCIGVGPNGREMHPGSPFLQSLEPLGPEIRCKHIASKADQLVRPKSALRGELSEDNVLFEDLGHAGLITSSRVADKICEWLKS